MPRRRPITPGFIDTHCHVSGVNELYSVNANVRRVRELLANLQAAGGQDAGRAVGHGRDVRRHQARRRRSRGGTSTRCRRTIRSSSITAAAIRAGTTPRRSRWPASRRARPIPTMDDSSATRAASSRAASPSSRATCSARWARARRSRRSSSASAGGTACVTSRSCSRRRASPSVHDAGADRDRVLAYEDARANGELRHRACFLVRGPGGLRRLQGRGHLLRVRRRVDTRRRREVRRRRLGVRADHAHEHAVCRDQRLRHPDDDAAGDRRGGRGRAPPQLPRGDPRQRRRHDRHGAEGVRKGAREVSAARMRATASSTARS